MDSDTGIAEREEVERRVRTVLSGHPVSFAMLFGSASTGSSGTDSDIDIAIEFEAVRPSDEGYSDVFLAVFNE